jgi:parvulin-like peptidyl-prolyl isomerase
VIALAPGGWQGPVGSAYGPHLVRLIEVEPSEAPPFERVRGQVEAEWRQQTAADLREAQYHALRARYEVVLPGAAAE